MKVVILCGGFGTRLQSDDQLKPKPMTEIGNKPIVWHIMNIYAHYGFNDFILCLGFQSARVREYFLNYELMNRDLTVAVGKQDDRIKYHGKLGDLVNWNVTLVNTGENAQTGARIKRIERYISEDCFMVTYGDGLSDVNIQDLLHFHEQRKRIGTITGVRPSSRFGELIVKDDSVVQFSEKPQTSQNFINGGFFVFQKSFFKYLKDDDGCSLEREPLERLAADGQLSIFKHEGFWQCMDTRRELVFLNELWQMGKAPWKIEKK